MQIDLTSYQQLIGDIFPFWSPTGERSSDLRVSQVAKKALIELAGTCALTLSTYCAFDVLPIFCVSFCLKGAVLAVVVAVDRLFLGHFQNEIQEGLWSNIADSAMFSTVAWVHGFVGILVHELGHMAAIRCFYSGGVLSICEFFPFEKACVELEGLYQLTSFGKILGERMVSGCIALSGVAASFVMECFTLFASKNLKEISPRLSDYLSAYALVTVVREVEYGVVSWLFPYDHENSDFLAFQSIMGISPLITTGTVIFGYLTACCCILDHTRL